ncbi:MAG: hypothetical protein KIT31_23810 [Deltaproteobacteria bacterium]|nr:hypothetical protein [Deltaproteobacteria bacterium]
MNGLYEDIDEDLDELDDESWLENDDLAERRRRRSRGAQPKGGNYVQPRLDKSPVSHTQLQAALARVGEDVKKLAAQVQSLESRADTTITRMNKQNQGLGQMAMLLPLLLKKSVTAGANGQVPPGTRVLVDDNDSLTLLLPLMMMSNYGGNGSNGNGQNDMAMMFMMFALLGSSSSNTRAGA